MTDIDFKEYWKSQRSSMNRSDDNAYYERKALEHARFMACFGPPMPTADFGCGAGELLSCLAPIYEVPVEAIDFSKSLLERAKIALKGTEVRLHNSDAMTFAAITDSPRWMTCGAVNQYSDENALEAFVDAFVENARAQQLFLFDTIDPIRLILTRGRVVESYVNAVNRKNSRVRQIAKASWSCLQALRATVREETVQSFGELGFGIKLRFWRELALRHGIFVGFISSVEFEYRYHVVLRKQL